MAGHDSPWFRCATDFWRNRKVAEAGFLAGSLHLAGIAYCSEQLTDGYVPANVCKILGAPMHGWVWIGDGERTPLPRDVFESGWYALATRLCEVGLWHEVDGGYEIDDYLDYQPPREEVEERKRSYRERAKKAAAARWQKDAGHPENAGHASEHAKPMLERSLADARAMPQSQSPNGVTSVVVKLRQVGARVDDDDVKKWDNKYQGVDLNSEATAWLEYNDHDLGNLRHPLRSWLGWLRKAAQRADPTPIPPPVHLLCDHGRDSRTCRDCRESA